MKGSFLLAIIASVTIATGYAQTEFPGIISIIDKMLTGGFGSCTGLCLAPKIQDLTKTVQQQCEPTVQRIQREAGTINNITDFYNVAIKRQGSNPSKMCGWMDLLLNECARPLLKRYCSDGIVNAMEEFIGDIRPYICSLEPPVMECILSPEVILKTDFSGCVKPLEDRFSSYFGGSDDFLDQWQRFYNNEIADDNGEKLYKSLKDLGTCVSGKIGAVTINPGGSCSKVEKLINDEVDKIIDYFRDTDILSCAMNPQLWRGFVTCGITFATDIRNDFKDEATPTNPDPLTDALAKGEYTKLKKYYYQLKSCVLGQTDKTCGKKWTYNVMNTQLAVFDALVESNGRTIPNYCLRFNAASKTKMMMVNMAFAVTLGAAFTP